jgi:tetratricopeptide (TPR) repeat protein
MNNKCKLNLIICLLGICGALLLHANTAAAQSSGQDYFLQGNNLYNQKKYAEAIASYHHAIQVQPIGQPRAYLNCARAYSMLKNFAASSQYYAFYNQIDPENASAKKIKAEYKEVQRKAGNQTYTRDSAQTSVLNQLNNSISAGQCWNRQGNGAFAYYDVLIRAGFAEPELYDIQKKLIDCITTEIENDIRPADGQPLPALDRVGWEYIRNKLSKARKFVDVHPDETRLKAVESTALGWEAYYRGSLSEASSYFKAAASAKPNIVAAWWGQLMMALQNDDSQIIQLIDDTEKVYQNAGIKNTEIYFILIRAQAWRNLGDIDKSMMWLDKIEGAM